MSTVDRTFRLVGELVPAGSDDSLHDDCVDVGRAVTAVEHADARVSEATAKVNGSKIVVEFNISAATWKEASAIGGGVLAQVLNDAGLRTIEKPYRSNEKTRQMVKSGTRLVLA